MANEWINKAWQSHLDGGPHITVLKESATQQHELGRIVALADGRAFIYCVNAAVALRAGTLLQSAVTIANHRDCTTAAAAKNATSLTLTPGATAGAENLYAGGYAMVHGAAGVGEGRAYKIKGHLAITSSTAFTLNLWDPLQEAVTTASLVSLVHHPCKNVVIHDSPPTGTIIGVAPIDVTASYYFWAQTWGPAVILTENITTTAGTPAVPGATTDGSVTELTIAASGAAYQFSPDEQIIGTFMTAVASGASIGGTAHKPKLAPVFLKICR